MGRPLVGYVAEYLARHGCRELAVNLHHEPESVRAALGDGSRFGVRLRYVEEPEILGTSGALDNARDFFGDETFVVVNGKIATDIDLTAAVRTHRETGALATLVLRPNDAPTVSTGRAAGHWGLRRLPAPLMPEARRPLQPKSQRSAQRAAPASGHCETPLSPGIHIPSRASSTHPARRLLRLVHRRLPAAPRRRRRIALTRSAYWYEHRHLALPRHGIALMRKRPGLGTGRGLAAREGADVRDAVLGRRQRGGGARVRLDGARRGRARPRREFPSRCRVVPRAGGGRQRPEKALAGGAGREFCRAAGRCTSPLPYNSRQGLIRQARPVVLPTRSVSRARYVT